MCDSGPRFVRCLTSTWSDRSLKTTPLTSTTTLTISSGSWRNCVPRSETTKWPNWKPSKKLSPFLSKFCVKCTIELKDYFCRMVLYIHVNLFEAKLFIFHGDEVVRFEKIYFLIMKALWIHDLTYCPQNNLDLKQEHQLWQDIVFNCSKMVDISELVIIWRCFIINWFSQKIFLLSLKAKDTGNLFQIWWNQEALYH